MAFFKYGFEIKGLFPVIFILSFLGICCGIFYLSSISKDSKPPVLQDRGILNTTARQKFIQTCQDKCESRFANKDELRKLGAIVYRRLQFIQSPKSCDSRRKLHCLVHRCGFGCKVNTISYCMMLGYALNRTTVITPRLTKPLKPLSSTCRDVKGFNRTVLREGHENYQLVQFRLIRNKYKPNFFPPAVPEDLFENIRRYHDNPFLWWTGQISSFVFRIRKSTYDRWIRDEYMRQFKKPIVGVHVRRTDKIFRREASHHTVDEYMMHVERWFKSRPGFEPRIFLATDDLSVLEEISKKYGHYTVISNINITRAASVKQRKSELGTVGIIHDTYLLSKCDFVVCTFTSNICRLTFQLITAERGNVSNSVLSVYNPEWFFYGQQEIRSMVSAEMPRYPDNL